jgi:hypothetical protein
MENKYFNLFLILIFTAWIAGCASAARTTGSSANTGTEAEKAEDLSKYRPKFNVPSSTGSTAASGGTNTSAATPTRHVNAKVATLLDTAAIMNKSIRYAAGYRILAYSGVERKAAMDIRNAIVKRIPEERDYFQFNQPTFRLKIGDYFSRIEAQQVLLRIKDIAPNAMIVVDQINVK